MKLPSEQNTATNVRGLCQSVRRNFSLKPNTATHMLPLSVGAEESVRSSDEASVATEVCVRAKTPTPREAAGNSVSKRRTRWIDHLAPTESLSLSQMRRTADTTNRTPKEEEQLTVKSGVSLLSMCDVSVAVKTKVKVAASGSRVNDSTERRGRSVPS